LFTVLDAAKRGNVLGHDGEVLESEEALLVVVCEYGLLSRMG
jgi:hypothetical protein